MQETKIDRELQKPMAQINVYLTFNGNCRQAMTFYKKCLGGDLTFQTIGEMPLSAEMPDWMKNCILHATLSNDTLLLMASDMVGEEGLVRGNSVSLSLHCDSEEQIRDRYAQLSEGGTVSHPVSENFFGDLHGDLIDKFGHHWILYCNKNTNH